MSARFTPRALLFCQASRQTRGKRVSFRIQRHSVRHACLSPAAPFPPAAVVHSVEASAEAVFEVAKLLALSPAFGYKQT
jgi:hypothetical protein